MGAIDRLKRDCLPRRKSPPLSPRRGLVEGMGISGSKYGMSFPPRDLT